MKKFEQYLLFVLLFSLNNILEAQWVNQPLNINVAGFYSIDFINGLTGLAIYGYQGNIVKTTNGGNSWSEVSSGTTLSFRKIVFVNNLIGYVLPQWGGNLLKTINGGNGWFFTTKAYSDDFLSMFDMFFVDENKGWINSGGGLYYTNNGGSNWQKKKSYPLLPDDGGAHRMIKSIYMFDTLNGIGIGEYQKPLSGSTYTINSLIAKTIDGGENWSVVLENTPIVTEYVQFSSRKIGYAVGWGGIYKTEDGGNSWYTLSTGMQIPYTGLEVISDNELYILAAKTKYNSVILHSTDGGISWDKQFDKDVVLKAISFSGPYKGWVSGWKSPNDGTGILFTYQKYNVILSSYPSIGGIVNGGGLYNFNDTVKVNASANSNYGFINWTENGTEVSKNLQYNFVIKSDRTLVANFVQIPSPPIATEATSISQKSFIANWGTVSGATGYYFDIAIDNGFVNLISGFNNLDLKNTTTYNITNLNPGLTYYYRIRAYNAGGISPNSNIISATTIPGNPIATSATLVTRTGFTANWNAVQGATGYFLDVAYDNQFTNSFSGYKDFSVGNVNSFLITGLTAGQTYYYRLRSNGVSGVSSNSNTVSVSTSLDTPLAVSASAITRSGFTANWNITPGATGYFMDLSSDSLFANYVGYNNYSVGNVSSFVLTGLTAGQIYYYRVRANGVSGVSPNSNIICITTLPDAPVATSATSISNTGFIANWNTVSGAKGYYLDIATDNEFLNYLAGYKNKDIGNVLKYQVSNLAENKTYFYRIQAYTSGGPGAYSNIIAIGLTDVKVVENGIVKTFYLYQNYPNPFNPSTKIKFGLPKESIVRLTIYNSLGQLLMILIDKELGAGIYSVNFDASKLPNGTYIYKLQAGEFVKSKKMTLIK